MGKICENARIKVNGHDAGTLFSNPFNFNIGQYLSTVENELIVEVTNLAANRIKDLDQRKVNWKKFYDINYVNPNRKKFNAANWQLRDSGLLGPVWLVP